jgi:ribosomal protein S10
VRVRWEVVLISTQKRQRDGNQCQRIYRIASEIGSNVSEYTELPVRWKEMSIFRNVRVLKSSANKQDQFSIETAMQRSAETLPRDLQQLQSLYIFKCRFNL